ncbi:MAG: hypothetical protein DRJ26_05050 [Candidatus Methanomethylicota archaeon]|uniref:Biotin protein ligase C-terminal domain-containing protein n=1 Tax=Thermoproteota archaeon TaxID=2056631 RepID=A0A497EY54_9CREN|nr:MAG: hypothetical protein DRJ26_05050 [Candidatus Verstraetearchaeota archaeon]
MNANLKLNDFPDELKKNSTSIFLETGKEVNLDVLSNSIISELMAIQKMDIDKILKIWSNYDCTLNRRIKVISDSGILLGVALNVNDDGSLTIKLDSGEVKKIYADEIKLQLL